MSFSNEVEDVKAGTNVGQDFESRVTVSPDTDEDLNKYYNLPIFMLL